MSSTEKDEKFGLDNSASSTPITCDEKIAPGAQWAHDSQDPADNAPIVVSVDSSPINRNYNENAPQVCYDSSPLFSVGPQPPSRFQPTSGEPTLELAEPSKPQSMICGLRSKFFWLLVTLAIVLVGSAVGGGVGGHFARRNGNDSAPASTAVTISPNRTTRY